MSERYDGPKGPEQEISDEQKLALIQRVRDFVPYAGQPVDRFGAYETRFLYGPDEGYVSIYIPGLSGVVIEGDFTDDAIRIIKRIPENLDNGTTIVHSAQYKIDEATLEAEYMEDDRGFSTETGERLDPKPDVSNLERFMEAYQLNQQFRVSPVFTADRLREVEEILDSLDPDDTF